MDARARTTWSILPIALVVVFASAGAGAQATMPARFSAMAIPARAAVGSVQPVEIVIERWSNDDENRRMETALAELGTKGILKTLVQLPRVGSFAAVGQIGYPIRYARTAKGTDGIERITLATDRYVGFDELLDQGPSLDYPITIIQLRLKPGGQGDGEAVPAARVAMDPVTKVLIVENYDIQPVDLRSVKRIR